MSDYRHKAAEFGAEVVDLATVRFTPGLLRCIPADLVRKHHVLPVAEIGSRLAIVTSDPSDLAALDDLHSILDREIELRVADKAQIDLFIERFYGDDKPSA
jgi:type IV pilus assembly protein PilB